MSPTAPHDRPATPAPRPGDILEVSLEGDLWVLPTGTTYGGGPRTHRDPDAPAIEDTPVRSAAEMLDEVGSIGTALRWAMQRGLVRIDGPGPERRESGDAEPLMMDYAEWSGGMSLHQWRTFAGLYGVALTYDDEPVDLEPVGTPDSWLCFSYPMEFNVGGVTRVDHVQMRVTYTRERPAT